jgi:agmatinase
VLHFGGITPTRGTKPAIALIPCGYEATTTFHAGTRLGPRRLLEASHEIELFDLETGCAPFDFGIVTLDEPEIRDNPEEMLDVLYDVIFPNYAEGCFPLLIGGEHTVAVAGARAACTAFPDLGVFQLDAHGDFRDSYRGNTLNHACVGRRFSELTSLVIAGVRSLSKEELASIERSADVTFHPAHELCSTGWHERVLSELPERVYLSVDLDVLDPSIMPGVGNPEPGGMTWRELTAFLDVLFCERVVVGADVCELCPIPGSVVSESVAARLVQRLCSLRVKAKTP